MSSKYAGMEDHDILIIVADSQDRQERHLETINSTISKHGTRLDKIDLRREIEREVEEDMGVKPKSRKKKAAEGSMYGGAGALIISGLYALGNALGWW